MGEIVKYVLCNVADEYVGHEMDSYKEARNAAEASAEPVAVVELTYSFEDSALVWTPEGGEHATVLTWPPAPADDEDDHEDDHEDDEDAQMPIVQTSCRHCELDIEGCEGDDEWRDRGNNTRCNDGRNAHAPA